MRGAKRINTLDFCSYLRADQFFMRASTFVVRARTSILRANTFVVRARTSFMRAKTSIVRENTFEVSLATRQNCIFLGMLPKLMENASKTAVVKATFAVIPPSDVTNSSFFCTFPPKACFIRCSPRRILNNPARVLG